MKLKNILIYHQAIGPIMPPHAKWPNYWLRQHLHNANNVTGEPNNQWLVQCRSCIVDIVGSPLTLWLRKGV